jgi:hypothetical protein
MRRTFVIAVLVLACAAPALAGCARANSWPTAPASAGDRPAGDRPAGDRPAGVEEADVYTAVLRRYLGTPGENSFPEHTFTTVYVLDRTFADAGDPMNSRGPGTPIARNTQQQVTDAVKGTAGVTDVVFIADRDTVLENLEGCAQVKDGGILITLGPPNGDDNEVKVPINGFVACLGATWLTYVVHNEAGSGWRVTGTTGQMAIA